MEVCLFRIATVVGVPPPPPPPPPPQPAKAAPKENNAKAVAKCFMAMSPKSLNAIVYP
jgi:hypothetical protein